MKIIPAPDFPTGGIMMGRVGVRNAVCVAFKFKHNAHTFTVAFVANIGNTLYAFVFYKPCNRLT